MTWHGTSLYIIDPILGQLVAWYNLNMGKKKLKTLSSVIDCFSFIFFSTVKRLRRQDIISALHVHIRSCSFSGVKLLISPTYINSS